MKNVSVSVREYASVSEFIRVYNYERISIDEMSIEGFDGECIVKSKGNIEIKNINCQSNIKAYVLQTEEDFIIKQI